jgi:AcrR family transcriptional regulator
MDSAVEASDVAGCGARPGLRRRGEALEDAIRTAACSELAAVGYDAFSMESVAARARTGKGSIYRRWPDKQHLVLDALDCGLPQPPAGDILAFLGPDISTRDAILTILVLIADAMAGEGGAIMRATSAECARDPRLAAMVGEKLVTPRRERMMQVLRRGVERGEVRASAVLQQVAEVGPVMVFHSVLTEGAPPSRSQIESLVDDVVMPMLRP